MNIKMKEIDMKIAACKRYRRRLSISLRETTMTVRMLPPRKDVETLMFSMGHIHSFAVMFDPHGGDEATLCFMNDGSTQFYLSRHDAEDVVAKFRLNSWTAGRL